MSAKVTDNPAKSAGGAKAIRMTSAAQASALMGRIAKPLTVKAAINEIVDAVSPHLPDGWRFTASRAHDILKQERGVRVWPEELDAIRAAAERKARIDAEIRAEMAAAAALLASVEASLVGRDEEFFSPEIGAARHQMDVVVRLLEGRER